MNLEHLSPLSLRHRDEPSTRQWALTPTGHAQFIVSTITVSRYSLPAYSVDVSAVTSLISRLDILVGASNFGPTSGSRSYVLVSNALTSATKQSIFHITHICGFLQGETED